MRRSNEDLRYVLCVQGQSLATSIASWFRRITGSTDPPGSRVGGRESLLVLIRIETLNRLRQGAGEAARKQGLTETDIPYGGFVADHIGRSLEGAYQADAAHASSQTGRGDSSPPGFAHDVQDGETAFVAVSISSTLAERLQVQTKEDIRREGITAAPSQEEFMFRRMGQLLEASYNRRA
jgi:hypothetical protein